MKKNSKILLTIMIIALTLNTVNYAYAETPVKEKYDFDEDTTEWLVEEPDTPPVGSTQYLITDWYGGWWVDAEKIPGSDGAGNPPPDNVGDEDDLACWAATASNMIDYAGWGFVGGMDDADEYLDHYEDHWTDHGSLTEYGLEWWFDGTVTWPGVDWADEDVAGGGDFWDDTGSLSYGANDELTWDETQTLDKLDDWLRAGYPCGFGIYPNTPPGGHAITCWGFNYDPADPDYYVGVWVTDSDSHKGQVNAPDALRYYEVNYVEYETGKYRWEMSNYGSGWHIASVAALHQYDTNRPTADSNGPYIGYEGTAVVFDATGSSDPDGDTLQYHWNIEDAWTGWSASPTVSHTWWDEDDLVVDDVYVEVHDGHLKDTEHTTVVIYNVAPTLDTPADQSVDEGDTVLLSVGFTDPGTKDTHTVTIIWGDGSPTETGTVAQGAGSGTVSGSHVYGDNGAYTVSVTVEDNDGSSDTETCTITVSNVPPDIDPIDDQTVDEADAVNLYGTFTDPGTLDTHTADVNWGDGNSEPLTVSETDGSGSFSGSHVYGDNGYYTVTVTVTDDDGDSDTEELLVTVNNVAPTVTPFGPFTIDEGETVTLSADASDPGSDDLTFTWEFEHGSTTTTIYYNDGIGSDPYPSPGPTYPVAVTDSVSQAYGDDYVYSVTLTVTDDDGGETTYITTVTVNNVDPTITTSDLQLPYPDNPDFILPLVHTLEFSASASDPGSDDLTFTWDWGDSSSDTHTYYNDGTNPDPYPSPGPTYPIAFDDTASHIYGAPGLYTVTLIVTDDDTGVSESVTWEIKVLTPEEAKHDILDYIKGLPGEAFNKHPDKKKATFENMFNALDDMLDEEEYNGFVQDITNNIRSKCDGSVDGKAKDDWVIDPYAQEHICSKIDDLVEYITIVYL